jgi:hypothetical protein
MKFVFGLLALSTALLLVIMPLSAHHEITEVRPEQVDDTPRTCDESRLGKSPRAYIHERDVG